MSKPYRGPLGIMERLGQNAPLPSMNRIAQDRRDAIAEIDRLRAALKPFAEVGKRFVAAVASGAIPAGASLSRLKTDPLIASDLVAAANAFQQQAEISK